MYKLLDRLRRWVWPPVEFSLPKPRPSYSHVLTFTPILHIDGAPCAKCGKPVRVQMFPGINGHIAIENGRFEYTEDGAMRIVHLDCEAADVQTA